MNTNRKKKVVSIMLCVAMLMPMASMAMPVGAQGEDAFASSSVDTQKDIGEPGVDYVDGEVIVKFKSAVSGVTEGQVMILSDDLECTVKNAWNFSSHNDTDLVDAVVLKSDTLSTVELLSRLSECENIESVECNSIYRMSEDEYTDEDVTANDSFDLNLEVENSSQSIGIKERAHDQWGLNNPDNEGIDIGVDELEQTHLGSIDRFHPTDEEIVVAVLDTGLTLNDVNFSKDTNLWIDPEYDKVGYNVLNPGADAKDTDGHGTRVAGVIGANNRIVQGVMPNVKIMPIKICEKRTDEVSLNTLLEAILYLIEKADKGVNIVAVNVPFDIRQQVVKEGYVGTPLSALISTAGKVCKMTFVCAAGNQDENLDLDIDLQIYNTSVDGEDAQPYIITVGAMDNKGECWEKSNYGVEFVDVFAPGVDILTTCLGSEDIFEDEPDRDSYSYTYASGTEYAAAFISGSIGLLKLCDKTWGSGYIKTPENVKYFIKESVDSKSGSLRGICSSNGFFTFKFLLDKYEQYETPYGWAKNENGKWQYRDDDGNYLKGWQYDLDGFEGKRFFFDEDGFMAVGWQSIEGEWYYFKDNGVMQTSWFKDADGRWYYLDDNNGKMIKGWFNDPDDNAWYFFSDVSDGDKVLGGMVTGWLYDDSMNDWLYFNKDTSNNEADLGKLVNEKDSL